MIEKLTISNFRVFQEPTEFELAPITILTGRNNSGKSSLLKALLVLSDFMESHDQTVLDLNGRLAPRHRLSKFGNAKSWNSKSKEFSITRVIDDLEIKYVFAGEEEDTQASLLSFSILNLKLNQSLSLKRLSPNSFELSVSDLFIESFLNPSEGDQASFEGINLEGEINRLKQEIDKLDAERNLIKESDVKRSVEITYDSQQIRKRIQSLTAKLSGGPKFKIFTEVININDENARSNTLANIISQGILLLSDKEKLQIERGNIRFNFLLPRRIGFILDHLGPNRAIQARIYPKYATQNELSQIINDFALLHPPRGSGANLFLSKWLKTFEIGDDIEIKLIEGEASSLMIVKDTARINLVDLGFGAGQLIAILLKLTNTIYELRELRRFRTRNIPFQQRNFTILIEEPESNLHPRLQSLLADLFFDAYQTFKIKFIIETHSEYLMRKTQVMVKSLGADHPFKVYYLDNKKAPMEIKYRPDGLFENDFGPGFFDESSNLALDLF